MDPDDRISRHLRQEAATVEPDTELLSDLKGRAAERRNRRRFAMAAAAVGAAAAIALGVVIVQDDSSDDKVDAVAPVVTATTGPPITGTSSTSSSSTSSTAAAPALPKNDWDNVRFDAGVVKELRRVGDQWLLTFDRIQVDGKSAADFTEEPILCCHTDAMTTNDNPALRTYYVSTQAEVLELANRPFTCPGPDEEGYNKAPRWEPRKLADMARTTKWDQWDGVALTFDPQGNVIRIRLGGGC
jgi:hypothetical protein